MNWNQKDSLDLLLMIVGAIIGGVVALCVLHYVFVPFTWASIAVPASALVSGYTLRRAMWHRGPRKQF
jgi:hypothetical protein